MGHVDIPLIIGNMLILVLVLILLGLEIHRRVRNIDILGPLQYRVITRSRNFQLFLTCTTFLVMIYIVYQIPNRTYPFDNQYLIYQQITNIALIIAVITQVLTHLRGYEIRESGISTEKDSFTWDQILYYHQLDDTTVEIITNQEHRFSGNCKRIEWDVSDNRFEELIRELGKYVNKVDSDETSG